MTKKKVEFVFDERSLVTQEEIDMLLFRVDDPDWDVSQRGDVWELLPRLIGLAQSCANALRSPAPAATVTANIQSRDKWWREYIDLAWKKAEEYSGGNPEKFIFFLAGALPALTRQEDLEWSGEVAKRLGVGTPSVSQQAATVAGWRLLEVGEKLQDGDEWLDEATGEWEPNLYPQDKLLVNAKVRRRLTPPALAVDAVTAVVDDILSDLYKRLIDKSWENSETFEAYQDAWEHVADVFNVGKFDWTRGERPRTHALAAVREGSE